MEKDAGKVVEEYISIPSYSVGEDYGAVMFKYDN